MGQALPGHGPASGPASGARKRSGHTLERTRPMVELRNAGEQLPAEMLASGQFRKRGCSRPHCGVRRSPLVHWRLLTRLLDSPVVVWSWFCDIKIPIPTVISYSTRPFEPFRAGSPKHLLRPNDNGQQQLESKIPLRVFRPKHLASRLPPLHQQPKYNGRL